MKVLLVSSCTGRNPGRHGDYHSHPVYQESCQYNYLQATLARTPIVGPVQSHYECHNSIMDGSQVFLKSEMEEGVGAPRTCTHIQTCGLFHCPKVLKIFTKVSEDIPFCMQALMGHPG